MGAAAELLGIDQAEAFRWRIVAELERRGEKQRAKGIGTCGRSAAWMRCTYEGRDLFKIMRCGRQECPDCGQPGSDAHDRRVARAARHVGPIRAGAKLVFTLPPELRELVKDRKSVAKLHRCAWRAAKAVLGEPPFGAVSALHYFGDKRRNWLTFHPHVELLLPGDYHRLPVEQLQALREAWATQLRRSLKADVPRHANGRSKVVVWYGTRRQAWQWAHAFRYALRPTVGPQRFADLCRYSPELADLLCELTRRVDNVRYFGAMSSRHYKATLAKLAELQAAGVWYVKGAVTRESWSGCPCCGSPVEFLTTIGASEIERQRELLHDGPRGWLVDGSRDPPPAEGWSEPFLTLKPPTPKTPESPELVAAHSEPAAEQGQLWE